MGEIAVRLEGHAAIVDNPEFKEQLEDFRPSRIKLLPQGTALFEFGGQKFDSMAGVILAFRRNRLWWPKGPDGQPLTKGRPDCLSYDAVSPVVDCNNRQNDYCKLCAKSKFVKVGVTNKPPECKLVFRFAFLLLEPVNTVMPCLFSLPPVCHKQFNLWRDEIVTQGLVFSSFLTRIKTYKGESKGGLAVSLTTFIKDRQLEPAEAAVAQSYRKMFMEKMERADITADDYVPPSTPESEEPPLEEPPPDDLPM
jgi:hypothetical protein